MALPCLSTLGARAQARGSVNAIRATYRTDDVIIRSDIYIQSYTITTNTFFPRLCRDTDDITRSIYRDISIRYLDLDVTTSHMTSLFLGLGISAQIPTRLGGGPPSIYNLPDLW